MPIGMGGIWELLDGKIWEWDLSFGWEWTGNEVIEVGGNWYEKNYSSTFLVQTTMTPVQQADFDATRYLRLVRQGGYISPSVCLYVCLCLFAC